MFIAFSIIHSSILPLMALNSLYCADVPLSNYSLTHSYPQSLASASTHIEWANDWNKLTTATSRYAFSKWPSNVVCNTTSTVRNLCPNRKMSPADWQLMSRWQVFQCSNDWCKQCFHSGLALSMHSVSCECDAVRYNQRTLWLSLLTCCSDCGAIFKGWSLHRWHGLLLQWLNSCSTAQIHIHSHRLFMWAEKQAYKRMQCRSPIRNQPNTMPLQIKEISGMQAV